MLVSPLRIFATLAVATAVGVSAQDACMLSCFAGAVSPSTCTSLYVLFAHRHWTSFPHAFFLF
jgi:hypothetical protein